METAKRRCLKAIVEWSRRFLEDVYVLAYPRRVQAVFIPL